MSEIYRMMEEGTAPPLPEDGKCDAWTNQAVDDCRGAVCDRCLKSQEELQGEAEWFNAGWKGYKNGE